MNNAELSKQSKELKKLTTERDYARSNNNFELQVYLNEKIEKLLKEKEQ